jgi:hypothetical protein
VANFGLKRAQSASPGAAAAAADGEAAAAAAANLTRSRDVPTVDQILRAKEIFETIYFSALSASCDLAERDGPYQSFEGTPVHKG